jgi:hypothetical protein
MISEDEIINTFVPDDDNWHISNDADADWVIEKIVAVKNELRHKEMVASTKIEQIQQWLDKERAAAEKEIAYREYLLKEYFESLPADFIKETKTQKIYKLPSGTLRLKQQQPEYIRNDELLLQWVKTNKPRFVRIKESVDWAGLKELVVAAGDKVIDTQTGEVIDGVIVVEREPKFIVEVG